MFPKRSRKQKALLRCAHLYLEANPAVKAAAVIAVTMPSTPETRFPSYGERCCAPWIWLIRNLPSKVGTAAAVGVIVGCPAFGKKPQPVISNVITNRQNKDLANLCMANLSSYCNRSRLQIPVSPRLVLG
jgi:hypothetical protein